MEPQKSHVGVSSKLMFHHLPVFRWVYDKLIKATRDPGGPNSLSKHLKAWMGLRGLSSFFSWDRPKQVQVRTVIVFTEGI